MMKPRQRPAEVPAPPSASCWICLEEGRHEETGQPVRRNCACRGDAAGYAHLKCLSDYAWHKADRVWKGTGECDFDEYTEPYKTCPNCKQSYAGQLLVDLATELVARTEQQNEVPMPAAKHAACTSTSIRRLIARDTLLFATIRAKLETLDKAAAVNLARSLEEVLGEIEDISSSVDVSSSRNLSGHANSIHMSTLMKLTIVHTHLGSGKAAQYISNLRAYAKKGASQDQAVCEAMIAQLALVGASQKVDVKTKRDEAENPDKIMNDIKQEFLVKSGRDAKVQKLGVLEQACKEVADLHGADSRAAMLQMSYLSICLYELGRCEEARKMRSGLTDDISRVLGFDNELAQTMIVGMNDKMRIVALLESDCKTRAEILRLAKDSDKYIGIVLADDDTRVKNGKFKVSPSQIILPIKTWVVCAGLKKARHLNGKRGMITWYSGDSGRYTVSFPDGNLAKDCLVKRENVRML